MQRICANAPPSLELAFALLKLNRTKRKDKCWTTMRRFEIFEWQRLQNRDDEKRHSMNESAIQPIEA